MRMTQASFAEVAFAMIDEGRYKFLLSSSGIPYAVIAKPGTWADEWAIEENVVGVGTMGPLDTADSVLAEWAEDIGTDACDISIENVEIDAEN